MKPHGLEREAQSAVVSERRDADGVADDVVDVDVLCSLVSACSPNQPFRSQSTTYGKVPPDCSAYAGKPDPLPQI